MGRPGAPRMTMPTQQVLRALLEDPSRKMYGLEICRQAGLPSGTIHPILARLEQVGWLISDWEKIDPKTEGRPRRRYYQVNPNSISAMQAALARVEAQKRRLKLSPKLAGGGR